MRRRTLSPLLLGALPVGVLMAAGCGPAPVAPLPGQWPSHTPGGIAISGPTSGIPSGPGATAPPATPATAPRPPATPRRTGPTAAPSATTELSPACLPRVIYPVDGSDSAAMPRALCLTVASVLRVQNVGPGTVTATPADKVAQHWEGGVIDCRLLSAGTVTVEVAGEWGTHTITVFVVD